MSNKPIRWSIGLSAAVGLVLLFTTNLFGQAVKETSNRPAPAATPATSRFPTEAMVRAGLRPTTPVIPRSSVVEIKSSLIDLRENVRLLQVMNEELQGLVSSPSWPDYETVLADATDIGRLIIRLARNLELPHADAKTAAETLPAVSADELKASMVALDAGIQTVLNDPLLTQPRTVDVKQLTEVGANFETLARRSSAVRKQAQDLATKAGRKSAHIKSRLGPVTMMQITLECGAWSMTDLLKRPGRDKDHDSINLVVKVRTIRHKLAEQALLSIDQCVDGETFERTITDKIHYVAIVSDFTSFEVKSKVFAYRVTYEIGFARNGQIEKRFNPPVSFYYVDEAGDGDFELLRTPVELGLVPDWALARKH